MTYPQRIDEYLIDQYTSGDCYILAQALHELAGYPVWAFMCTAYCGHCFVELPDGRFLDIMGTHTREELKDGWLWAALDPKETMRFYRLEDAYELVNTYDWLEFQIHEDDYDVARFLLREYC